MKLTFRMLLMSLGLAVFLSTLFANPAIGNAQADNLKPVSPNDSYLIDNQGFGQDYSFGNPTSMLLLPITPYQTIPGCGYEFDNSLIVLEQNPESFVSGETPWHNSEFTCHHLKVGENFHIDLQVKSDPWTPNSWAIKFLPQAIF